MVLDKQSSTHMVVSAATPRPHEEDAFFAVPDQEEFSEAMRRVVSEIRHSVDAASQKPATCDETQAPLPSASKRKKKGMRTPFLHQLVVARLMAPDSPLKGLLLMHGLGTGKTCSAIRASLPHLELGVPVLVLTPAKLAANFFEQVAECGAPPLRSPGTTPGRTYAQFNYNGLTPSKLAQLLQLLHSSARCLVIVDEAHNFVSAAMPEDEAEPRSACRRVLEALAACPTARVLALTATPMLNHPREIAWMAHLVLGEVRMHRFVVPPRLRNAFVRACNECPHVAGVEALEERDAVSVRLLPPGFVRSGGGRPGVRRVDEEVVSRDAPAAQSAALMRTADQVGIPRMGRSQVVRPSLPLGREAFEAAFMAEGEGVWELKDRERLFRSLVGMASAYEAPEGGGDVYPRKKVDGVAKCPMSRHQFGVYAAARGAEIESEAKAVRHKGGAKEAAAPPKGQVYKARSRSACNFAFPAEVTRPFMSDERRRVRQAAGRGVDGAAGGAGGDTPQMKRAYEAALSGAVAALDAATHLSGPRLAELSPKMSRALKELEAAEGCAMVYSQFRTVEGVAILGRVLQAAGWRRWPWSGSRRSSSASAAASSSRSLAGAATRRGFAVFGGGASFQEDARTLDVFCDRDARFPNLRGQTIKALLVSQSGAEGISLLNVRLVLLMEPYWNDVRSDQVIGRAIRACSHHKLPPEDRDVSVLRLCSCIPPAFMTEPGSAVQRILRKDGGSSVDELLMTLSKRKSAVLGEVARLVRAGAVDCERDCGWAEVATVKRHDADGGDGRRLKIRRLRLDDGTRVVEMDGALYDEEHFDRQVLKLAE
jgi:P-loop containing NTP hydrolase pore-1